MAENQDITPKASSDEIDLIEVFKKVWEQRKIIYKSVAVCFVLGIIVIIGSPKEYKSEIVLMEETSSKSGGMSSLLSSLGGLASLSGLSSMNGSSELISPALYPEIVKSTPFLLDVMKQKVTLSKNDSLITVASFFDRYTKPSFSQKLKKYSFGLPGTMLGWIRKEKPVEPIKPNYPFSLTRTQSKAAAELAQRIKVKDGESGNTLMISVEAQDPVVSAQLTDSVVKCLTKYVIDYRTQKAKKDLEFVEARYAEAREKYNIAQQALAYYKDQNKNVILASTKTQEDRLNSEFTLASSIYTGLAQQLEQSKMKLQESTPIFKVIEPVKLGEKSKPMNFLLIILMSFFGFIIGIGFILWNYLKLLYIYK